MRDRLIELRHEAMKLSKNASSDIERDMIFADYLLANGVIVPPCKVGDTLWELNTENPFEEDLRVMESKVERFMLFTSLDVHSLDCVGKTVFLTREEAEAALKGGGEGCD